jgi:hypothetical protein
MRPVRFAIAALSAATLIAVTVATVAAGRVAETVDTIEAIHVDLIPATDATTADPGIRVELVAGSDGDRFLDIRVGGPEAEAGTRTRTGTDVGTDAGIVFAFRGLPSTAVVSVDPSLARGSVTATFDTLDGQTHTLQAQLRATGTPEQWGSGPYAVTLPGAAAALRTCTDRSVIATVDLSLDGTRIPAAGTDRLAQLVVRTCSTVALYR